MVSYTLEMSSPDMTKDPGPVLDELRKQGAKVDGIRTATQPAEGRFPALKIVHIRIVVGSLRNTIAHGIGYRFGWTVVIRPPDEMTSHVLYKPRG